MHFGDDICLTPREELPVRMQLSMPKGRLKIHVLILADGCPDATHPGSLADNFLECAQLEIHRTDIDYKLQPAAPLRPRTPNTIAKQGNEDANIVVCEHLDNRAPFPYPDGYFDVVAMRRGLCICPGEPEIYGGCGGVSMQEEVAVHFLSEVCRVLNKLPGSAAYLHGVPKYTSEPFWRAAAERCTAALDHHVRFWAVPCGGCFSGFKVAWIPAISAAPAPARGDKPCTFAG
jgi:hypothetical protein